MKEIREIQRRMKLKSPPMGSLRSPAKACGILSALGLEASDLVLLDSAERDELNAALTVRGARVISNCHTPSEGRAVSKYT